MTREEKLEVIADILEVEEVEEDNVLEDFETWDSIAVLSVISVITEETGLFPHANEIKKFKTVSDIMKAIGDLCEKLYRYRCNFRNWGGLCQKTFRKR